MVSREAWDTRDDSSKRATVRSIEINHTSVGLRAVFDCKACRESGKECKFSKKGKKHDKGKCGTCSVPGVKCEDYIRAVDDEGYEIHDSEWDSNATVATSVPPHARTAPLPTLAHLQDLPDGKTPTEASNLELLDTNFRRPLQSRPLNTLLNRDFERPPTVTTKPWNKMKLLQKINVVSAYEINHTYAGIKATVPCKNCAEGGMECKFWSHSRASCGHCLASDATCRDFVRALIQGGIGL